MLKVRRDMFKLRRDMSIGKAGYVQGKAGYVYWIPNTIKGKRHGGGLVGVFWDNLNLYIQGVPLLLPDQFIWITTADRAIIGGHPVYYWRRSSEPSWTIMAVCWLVGLLVGRSVCHDSYRITCFYLIFLKPCLSGPANQSPHQGDHRGADHWSARRQTDHH